MDLIYRPERTQFLKLAASMGIATVSGVEMFLAQGLAQWELWTGKSGPQPAIRRAVMAKLRAEENTSRQEKWQAPLAASMFADFSG